MTRLDAIKQGLLTYDSKQCPTCGGVKRYTKTGNCPVCIANNVKKSRRRIKEQIKNSEIERSKKKDAQHG